MWKLMWIPRTEVSNWIAIKKKSFKRYSSPPTYQPFSSYVRPRMLLWLFEVFPSYLRSFLSFDTNQLHQSQQSQQTHQYGRFLVSAVFSEINLISF